MTNATTTSRAANAGAQSKSVPNAAETKVKRQRGKAPHADKGIVKAAAVAARTDRLTDAPITDATSKPSRQTKVAHVRAMLAEPGGVSLAALIVATGWQAHTLRAFLSGLRKEGLILTRRRERDETIYAIESDAGLSPPYPASTSIPAETSA